MNGFLNRQQIQYVLFHLYNEFDLTPEIISLIYIAQTKEELSSISGRIVFLLSFDQFDINKVQIRKKVPVLFPNDQAQSCYSFDDNNNLVFYDDLLKSCFYLLSGYQEYAYSGELDKLRRYPFKDSVQNKLHFIHRPIVNDYLSIIRSGINEFLQQKNRSIAYKKLFPTFGFMLSHDIDRVDFHDIYTVGYKLKEIIGLRKSHLSRTQNMALWINSLLIWARLKKHENPYWNFEFLRAVERRLHFQSTFYFLGQGIKHSDAYYSYNEARIQNLFQYLIDEKCEIGCHGTVQSTHNAHVMCSDKRTLEQACSSAIVGIRQHRLLWDHPNTAKLQASSSFDYDTTLGFAHHEGFRHSYCLPYLLYDFETNQPILIWEFPLMVMDVTLFSYQKYSFDTAQKKCVDLLDKVSQYGGIFTLLWHNSFFDEVSYPGITKFYTDLLQYIHSRSATCITGNTLVEKLGKASDHWSQWKSLSKSIQYPQGSMTS